MTSVLYCNNYAATEQAVENVKNGLYPRHHLWGIYELCNSDQFFINFSESPDMSLHKSRIVRLVITFLYEIKIFKKFHKIDVVYAACTHQIDFFAFMKCIKLFKGRLMVVVHHPKRIPFSKHYQKIICISRYTEKYLRDKYGILNTEYLFWGPDLAFYHKYKENSEKKYDFYLNGKTLRDFNLVADAFRRCDYKVLALQNMMGEGKKVQAVSDVENIRFCCLSKIMLIPIKSGILQICGLTSLIDALALEMPFIISDSANLGFSELEVKEMLGGTVYKAGDKQDFLEKLKDSIEHYKPNIAGLAFILANNYEHFRTRILQLITSK